MSSLVGLWIALAALLFWAVGAYNRLVRLRSQAIAAFALVSEQFAQYVTLIQLNFSVPMAPERSIFHDGLMGAAQQFDSSLKVAKSQPLDDLAMRALGTAYEALSVSWSRLRNEPPDLAGQLLPDALQQQWEQITRNANHARAEFNQFVQAYNDAIVQFPASMLVKLIGLRSAHSI